MPSTLVHLGIQGFVSRALVPGIDLRVVYLACVIPDIPWIAQRAILFAAPAVDRIALMSWCAVQASLLYSLLLSAAFSALTIRPGPTFLVLGTGSLFHLLLDAIQVKWGRGVILFAPLDWRPVSLELLWPEHPAFVILLVASAIFVIVTWRGVDHRPLLARSYRRRGAICLALVAVYAFSPGVFTDVLQRADVYFAATIADTDGRAGKSASFDRAHLLRYENDVALVEIFSGERIRVVNVSGQAGDLISFRGRFVKADLFRATDHHLHPPYVRALASVVGLAFVLALWMQSAFVCRSRRRSGATSRHFRE